MLSLAFIKSRKARAREHFRRMAVVYLILFISVIPALIVCARVKINTYLRDAQRFKDLLREGADDVNRHFGKMNAILDGGRGLFLASSRVRPEEWNIFVDSMGFKETNMGVRDLGFAMRLPATNFAEHLRYMRQQRPDYEIAPRGQRDEYYPIIFLRDGSFGDVKAFGWDPYSSAVRREAMDRARDTGKSACSGRILMTLPDGQQPRDGHVVYLPVYFGAVDPGTIEERRAKLAGFVFTSFLPGDLWKAMLRERTIDSLDVEIFDDSKLVYDSHPAIAPDQKRSIHAFTIKAPLRMGGHKWQAHITTLPAFDAKSEHNVVWWVALGSVVIIATMVALTARQARARAAAEQMAATLEKSKRALAESEARFRRLADNAQDVIYRFRLTSPRGYDYISPSIEKLSGHPPTRFYGDVTFLREFIHPDDRHLLRFEPPFENWFGRPIVMRWMRKDGGVIWTETRNVPVHDEQGNVIAMEGIARDISESKFTEDAIRRSEERLSRIIETIADAVVILDGAGEIAFVNAAAEESLSLSDNDQDEVRQLLARLRVNSRRSFTHNYRRGNREVVLAINAAPFSNEQGNGVVASIRDVTLEKENEGSLVESQTRLRILNNILGHMAAASDVTQIVIRTAGELARFFPDYRIVFSQAEGPNRWRVVSSEGPLESIKGSLLNLSNDPDLNEEFFGAKPLVVRDIVEDRRFEKLRSEKYFTEARAILEQPLRHGSQLDGLLSFHSAYPHQWTSAEKVMLQEIADYIAAAYAQLDVAQQRRQAESALQAEKERLAVTLRSIADGVITTDVEGKIVLMNHAAESITGWSASDAVGRDSSEVLQIVDEKTREQIPNPAQRVLKDGGIFGPGFGAILRARDGRERIVSETAAAIRDPNSKIIGAALVFRDVTEKRRFERELQKASKLESVGLLAGGIAHDFNNILSVILGNVTLCKMLAPPGSSLHERLAQAEKGSLRARELTQQLLTFSKGGAPIRKAASIAEIVHESVAFAARGSNVQCENQTAPDLWTVEVDEGQMSQVFNNLVINAVQAMPDGGKLRTRIENRNVEPRHNLPVSPGRYVHITVEDTGSGISREHLSKIFDPYFTTKTNGSGLGLATTYAIVQKHHGCITVESIVGQGTTFHIYIPASNVTLPAKPESLENIPQGRGRVLVMDDERAILDLAAASLRRFGYEVETALHGNEAVEKYRAAHQQGQPYAAVIMDLTVPGGMGGKETMQHLLQIDPKVRAIVSSGYSHDPVMSQYRAFGFAGVVEKPYRIESLAKTLGSILNPESLG